MAKWFLVLALTVAVGALGTEQTPYPYTPVPSPANFLPNYYNRPQQPLSPYLNLLRGGNPGVNYFYGVRPGTQGGVPFGGGFGLQATGSGFNRTNVLPTTLNPSPDPIPLDPAGSPILMLMPSGHPVTFGPGPGRQAPGTGVTRPGFQRAGVPPPGRPTTRR